MSDDNILSLQEVSIGLVLNMVSDAIKNGYKDQKGIPSTTQKTKNKLSSVFAQKPWSIKQLEDFYEQLAKDTQNGFLDVYSSLGSARVSQLLYILFGEAIPQNNEPQRVENALLAARETILGKNLYESAHCESRKLHDNYARWGHVHSLEHLSGNQIAQTIVSKLYHCNALNQSLVIKLYEVLAGLSEARFLSNTEPLRRDLKHFIKILDCLSDIDQANIEKTNHYFPFMQPLVLNKMLDRLKIKENQSILSPLQTNYLPITVLMEAKVIVNVFDKSEGAKLFNRLLDCFLENPYAAEVAYILSVGFCWAPRLFEKTETIDALPLLSSVWRIKGFSTLLETVQAQTNQTSNVVSLKEKEAFMRTLLSAYFEDASELEQLNKLVLLLSQHSLHNLTKLVHSELYQYKEVVQFFSTNRYQGGSESPYTVSRGDDRACRVLFAITGVFESLVQIAGKQLHKPGKPSTSLPQDLKDFLAALASKIQIKEAALGRPLTEIELQELPWIQRLNNIVLAKEPPPYSTEDSERYLSFKLL